MSTKHSPSPQVSIIGLPISLAAHTQVLKTMSEAIEKGESGQMKKGDTQAACAKAKLILSQNPSQREARAVVRKVEEANAAKAEGFSPQLAAALKNTITIDCAMCRPSCARPGC